MTSKEVSHSFSNKEEDMKVTYRDKEDKLVILDTTSDECLCPGVYVHVTRKSNEKIFYVVRTGTVGKETKQRGFKIEIISDVEKWLENHYAHLSKAVIDRFEQLGFKLKETA